MRKTFHSVAAFAKAHNLNDRQLAERLGCTRPHATKLRRGRKYRSLREPMHVSRECGVPLENLVDDSE